jgi:hypothetical protein
VPSGRGLHDETREELFEAYLWRRERERERERARPGADAA